jgi:lipopolysaccharide heptosyltransferase II
MTISNALDLSRTEKTSAACLLLALFFIPFSTALTNTFVAIGCASFALALAASAGLRAQVLRAPPAWLALALLGLLIVATSWSKAPEADIVKALWKYAKLLVLPVALALAWRDASLPRRALNYFLAGAGVLALSCYLAWLGLMPNSPHGWWRVGDASDAFAFKNHITIGILLGFAACLCLLKASYSSDRRIRLAGIAASIFFAYPVIFLMQGRTGYVVLFVGLLTLFLLRARITLARASAALVALVLLFMSFYAVSANFKLRTDALFSEVSTVDARTPNGQRVSFLQVGASMLAADPLFGAGTGSFSEAYAPLARSTWPAGSEAATMRYQPHSEFLLMIVQVGLLGSLLYFTLLGTLGGAALASRSLSTDSLALLWVIYVCASSFNSLLWDPTEGYWFLLLAGFLYVSGFPARPATDGRILVVSPNWIGDAVMAQPLLQMLARRYPGRPIDVLAPTSVAPIWRNMAEVDSVLEAPFRHGPLQLKARWQYAKVLRARGYGTAYVLPNTLKYALIPWLAGIPERVGYKGEMRYGLLNAMHHNTGTPRPMVPFYAALAQAPDAPLRGDVPRPVLQVSQEQIDAACESAHIARDRPLLVFAPGAEFGAAKRWPTAHFAALARAIVADNPGAQVALLGSPKDKQVCDEIVALAGDIVVFNLAGTTRLDQAVALIARADAVVSNDSGLLHIASALNRPVIALYGPTDPDYAPPFSDIASSLSLRLACAPCRQRECPLGHHDCMQKIDSGMVWQALRPMLWPA